MGAYGPHPASGMKPFVALEAQSITSATTTNGTAIDTRGFEGYAVFLFNAGTFTGASPAMDLKVQEDDNSGFSSATDVTSAAFAQVTTANDAAVFAGCVQLTGRERYLRVSAVSSGTITAIPMGVTCLLTQAGDSAHQDVTYSFDV
jgi:hypothetical protein